MAPWNTDLARAAQAVRRMIWKARWDSLYKEMFRAGVPWLHPCGFDGCPNFIGHDQKLDGNDYCHMHHIHRKKKACGFDGCPNFNGLDENQDWSDYCHKHRKKKTCGVPECTNPVDVSCEGNSIHCTQHSKEKACGKEGCTDTVSSAKIHRTNSKYCFDHSKAHQCAHRSCCELSEENSSWCEDHIERGATAGSSKRPRGKVKVKCVQEGCSKLAVETNGCCAVHSKLMFPDEPSWKTPRTLTDAQNCSIVDLCRNVGCTNNVCKIGGYRMSYCKTHYGRGRTKCFHDGCVTPAVSGGQVGLCITHGGGKRCQHTQCGKSAKGNSGYCVGHGGGKRCAIEGCTSSARSTTDFCTKHRSGVV